jgi:uncharacterized membrane protein YedE/YeeE
MTLDHAHFTPLPALLGGALIGLSAAWLLLVHGRIAGISGLLGRVLSLRWGSRAPDVTAQWIAAAFLAGLVAAPLLLSALGAPPAIHVDAGVPVLIVAGLLVGLGTRYAGGCTSGYGVCGLAQLSGRSVLATLLFMLTAFIVVALRGALRT